MWPCLEIGHPSETIDRYASRFPRGNQQSTNQEENASSQLRGFLGSSAGKESACNAGDLGLIPGLGRSPGKGIGYPLQFSGLENSMDCIVHEVTKSWTWLSDFHSQLKGHVHIHPYQTATNVLCLRNSTRVFPGGPVVKNPPSNAGDVGSIPGQGTKISHAAGQLSFHATTKPKQSPFFFLKKERNGTSRTRTLNVITKFNHLDSAKSDKILRKPFQKPGFSSKCVLHEGCARLKIMESTLLKGILLIKSLEGQRIRTKAGPQKMVPAT